MLPDLDGCTSLQVLTSQANGCDIAGAMRLGNVDEAAKAIDKVHTVVVHNSPPSCSPEQLTQLNHDCGDSAMVEAQSRCSGTSGPVTNPRLVPHKPEASAAS